MKKDKVVYKVVDLNRNSIKAYDANNLRELSLKYEKDTIVKAKPKTFGIFCFTDFNEASYFADHSDNASMILRCLPTGRKLKTPSTLINLDSKDTKYKRNINNLYDKLRKNKNLCIDRSDSIYNWNAPYYTVCYTSIKVLT